MVSGVRTRVRDFRQQVEQQAVRHWMTVDGIRMYWIDLHTEKGHAVFCGYFTDPGAADRRPVYHIHWLIAKAQGAGAETIARVCALADQYQIRLSLYPMPLDDGIYKPTQRQLERFYRRHGFKLLPGSSPKEMRRMPLDHPLIS